MEILIALVTGVTSALISLIGSFQIAKSSATTQMKITALNSFLTARLDAYKEFESAMYTWSERRDRSSCAAVYHAGNVVALVASEETISHLAKVQTAVREFEVLGVLPDPAAFGLDKLQLQRSMHDDLLSFQIPHVEAITGKTK